MTQLGEVKNTHFQFALGDNFYDDGVTDEHDSRFQDSFEDVFTAEHLMETPWFFALGWSSFISLLFSELAFLSILEKHLRKS